MIKKRGKSMKKRSKRERKKVKNGICSSDFILMGNGGMRVCGMEIISDYFIKQQRD